MNCCYVKYRVFVGVSPVCIKNHIIIHLILHKTYEGVCYWSPYDYSTWKVTVIVVLFTFSPYLHLRDQQFLVRCILFLNWWAGISSIRFHIGISLVYGRDCILFFLRTRMTSYIEFEIIPLSGIVRNKMSWDLFFQKVSLSTYTRSPRPSCVRLSTTNYFVLT